MLTFQKFFVKILIELRHGYDKVILGRVLSGLVDIAVN